MKNVKLDISNNGSKDISNRIMGYNMFASIGTSQKVYPHQVYGLATNAKPFSHWVEETQPSAQCCKIYFQRHTK
jgi:hypothetical protein